MLRAAKIDIKERMRLLGVILLLVKVFSLLYLGS